VKKNKKNEDTFEIGGEAAGGSSPEILDAPGQKQELSEVDVLRDQLLRQAAEYDNYRKRTAKERLELVPEITAGNVAAFLPILDNIERALEAECSDPNYKKGIEMVHESFVAALANLGVEEITAEDFDPAVHQAVQHVESEELASGKIAATFQKGYKTGNRIIRFAMVSIAK
jgi:molecular chaperone GrpE